jgi:hypothetical protein
MNLMKRFAISFVVAKGTVNVALPINLAGQMAQGVGRLVNPASGDMSLDLVEHFLD